MEPEKKAYDLSLLLEHLKGQGLDLAEDAAGKIYNSLKSWLVESAALSENAIDDLIVPFMGQIDKIVLPQIDKIDGEEG